MTKALALLFLVACAGAQRPPPTRDPVAQHNMTVEIRTACWTEQTKDDPEISAGTGVIVGPHTILTAEHVSHCPEGQKRLMVLRTKDQKLHRATVEIILPGADVAQLTTTDTLTTMPIRLGPGPTIGQTVCESSAVPRPTYRCGLTQAAGLKGKDGDVRLDMYVEYGNSGSGGL